MVTSNKLPEKKVVRMTEKNNSVVPQRTLLGEVNEHITCPLCRGYYIDATTIVECLHSFCRSCIIKHLQVKSYCPVCEMMINSAKPNIKLDKALQDIVYKLVPGLFQREMERRQQFYASRPGTAAAATPEQRGEDTERIIFSPEDVISFSLEYADVTDTDSVSSKSSDSNEAQQNSGSSRRYLQCPAVVNISHLKKFLSMKFNIDCSQFAVDILYKRVPLPDYYTLMDIAYIYNWKRNEPMRFFYQITDYVSIRNRLFEVNHKGSHYQDRKNMNADVDPNARQNLLEQGSEASSGADSPMPEEPLKLGSEIINKEKSDHSKKQEPVKIDEEVEKSQFLNSFELTAKSSSVKSSPTKSSAVEKTVNNSVTKMNTEAVKSGDSLKRKQLPVQHSADIKKLKIEIEKAKLPDYIGSASSSMSSETIKAEVKSSNQKKQITSQKSVLPAMSLSTSLPNKDTKPLQVLKPPQISKTLNLDSPNVKCPSVSSPQIIASPKRKPLNDSPQSSSLQHKTVSPLKLQVPKLESPHQISSMVPKTQSKKIPDLKPSIPISQINQGKTQAPVPKLRMDLLANHSDPTIDRSKILSQVKTSLGTPSPSPASGDPLKTLFDTCRLNIPSSLSITLTDQKQEARPSGEFTSIDSKKGIVNKNLSTASSSPGHKVPSPPVHNYIEILKLPESESRKLNKPEGNNDSKVNTPSKDETPTTQPKPSRSESSAKGPIPNLKPIADTKLGKNLANATAAAAATATATAATATANANTNTDASLPITFQQSFEQQLQTVTTDKKPKLPKIKGQVPKLVPATGKAFSAVNKLNTQIKSTNQGLGTSENKPNAALDLSTAPNIQQTKAFETMQSIANLAKKQGLPPKAQASQSSVYSGIAPRTLTPSTDTARVPSTSMLNQIKFDKLNQTPVMSNNNRRDIQTSNQIKAVGSPQTSTSSIYQMQSTTTSSSQPSPRQTRSPSSSPKLVIAEEKQPSSLDQSINQSNQITSTQLPSSSNTAKSESPKITPGPSKTTLKPIKSIPAANKITNIRQPITPTIAPNSVLNPSMDYLSQPQLMHHALLRHQMEVRTAAWLKARHDLIKNITNIAHHNQNDFNRDQQ